MKNKKQGNNSSKYKDGHVVALLVLSLVFLFLLTQLPVLEWGGFATKPVDLFSDIRVDEQDLDLPGDAEWQEEGTEWLNEGVDSLSSVEKDEPQDRQVVLDTIRVQETADTLLVTNISSDTAVVGNLPRRDGDVVLFEDFSPGKNGLSHLLSSLKERASLGRPVRLAFLGDSFIEADIFTQDVRSLLQSRYGGSGVGYVSMHSDFPGFRRSVIQSGEGWEVHSVLKPKEVDWKVMTLQQQYFVPLEGATAQYRGTAKIEHADSWALSRFVFIARQDCSVELKIADGEWQVFPLRVLMRFNLWR